MHLSNFHTWSRTLIAGILFLAAGFAVQAQSVDEIVVKQMAQRHVPGVSIAVVRDGKVVTAKGYGLANVELEAPATADTVYQLASVTKQFTATAILLLVQDGKLSLDDKASARLSNLPAAWANVTVRQLLSHTSGVPNYTAVPGFDKHVRADMTNDEVLKLVADAPLDFPSGSKFNYSNTGYYLLGMLIEKVSGKTYGEFISARIFQPLGMTASRFNDIHAVVKQRAAGYGWEDGGLRNADFVSPTQPFSAGALISTITDMIKWDAAMNQAKVLPQPILDSMWTATKLTDGSMSKYGFGWGVSEKKGHRMLEHSGGINGFSTDILRLPDDKLTVIVLTNSDSGQAPKIAKAIAATYVPEIADPPKAVIADASPADSQRLREFLNRGAAGTFNQDDFTADGQKFFFPDRINRLKGFLVSLGAIKSFELVEEEARPTGRRRQFRITGETGSALIGFILAADGKIEGIGISPE
jgi:CubicO group peptidase (beta-lactamase class C family)